MRCADVWPGVPPASTRKLYERKLQKLLDQGPPELVVTSPVVTEIDSNHNGNSDSDRYSDKEEGERRPQSLLGADCYEMTFLYHFKTVSTVVSESELMLLDCGCFPGCQRRRQLQSQCQSLSQCQWWRGR